ncbi:MAG: biotin/lipoate A/B protein ligase family protein [Candidatus Hatepunaea meridiana]|nr:biotin/lipoate A/B protein ligase family protein [Candidatus Hatepunaea meridiana]
MAADDLLAKALTESDYDAIVRFYRWDPPAVSLGCHQKPDAVNIKACRELGWDVVYRSTGGRALLHFDDLSYAVIIQAKTGSFTELHKLYDNIALAITRTLKQLELDAEITRPSVENDGTKPRLRAGLCLDSRVRGEVTINGRKIAAAAQHIYKDSILQHGSIMLAGDPSDIVKVSSVDESKRDVLMDKLRSKACALEELLNYRIDIKVLVDMFKVNFSDTKGLNLIEDDWTEDEIERIYSKRGDFEIF